MIPLPLAGAPNLRSGQICGEGTSSDQRHFEDSPAAVRDQLFAEASAALDDLVEITCLLTPQVAYTGARPKGGTVRQLQPLDQQTFERLECMRKQLHCVREVLWQLASPAAASAPCLLCERETPNRDPVVAKLVQDGVSKRPSAKNAERKTTIFVSPQKSPPLFLNRAEAVPKAQVTPKVGVMTNRNTPGKLRCLEFADI